MKQSTLQILAVASAISTILAAPTGAAPKSEVYVPEAAHHGEAAPKNHVTYTFDDAKHEITHDFDYAGPKKQVKDEAKHFGGESKKDLKHERVGKPFGDKEHKNDHEEHFEHDEEYEDEEHFDHDKHFGGPPKKDHKNEKPKQDHKNEKPKQDHKNERPKQDHKNEKPEHKADEVYGYGNEYKNGGGDDLDILGGLLGESAPAAPAPAPNAGTNDKRGEGYGEAKYQDKEEYYNNGKENHGKEHSKPHHAEEFHDEGHHNAGKKPAGKDHPKFEHAEEHHDDEHHDEDFKGGKKPAGKDHEEEKYNNNGKKPAGKGYPAGNVKGGDDDILGGLLDGLLGGAAPGGGDATLPDNTSD